MLEMDIVKELEDSIDYLVIDTYIGLLPTI